MARQRRQQAATRLNSTHLYNPPLWHLKFYSSVRLDVRRIATLKQNEEPIGNRVKVKVAKNKVAPPFKQAEFDVMFGEGISKEGEVIDYGVKLDIIDKSGAWFSYKDKKIGQGRENSKIFLKENPKICEEIVKAIQGSIGIEGVIAATNDEEED